MPGKPVARSPSGGDMDTPLRLLRNLNASRVQFGAQSAQVRALDAALDLLDRQRGLRRSRERHETLPDGQPAGPQRNLNWRAALDKLHAMRGRCG